MVHSRLSGAGVIVFAFAAGIAYRLDTLAIWRPAPAGLLEHLSLLTGFAWIIAVGVHLLRRHSAGRRSVIGNAWPTHQLNNIAAALLEQQGMPRMTARGVGLPARHLPRRPHRPELAQRLNVSPASISQTVAFLEQQGLIKRERTPGGRRERHAVDELWGRSTLAAMQQNGT